MVTKCSLLCNNYNGKEILSGQPIKMLVNFSFKMYFITHTLSKCLDLHTSHIRATRYADFAKSNKLYRLIQIWIQLTIANQ